MDSRSTSGKSNHAHLEGEQEKHAQSSISSEQKKLQSSKTASVDEVVAFMKGISEEKQEKNSNQAHLENRKRTSRPRNSLIPRSVNYATPPPPLSRGDCHAQMATPPNLRKRLSYIGGLSSCSSGNIQDDALSHAAKEITTLILGERGVLENIQSDLFITLSALQAGLKPPNYPFSISGLHRAVKDAFPPEEMKTNKKLRSLYDRICKIIVQKRS